ncbi:MAG TPA: AtpZ/AtpI family protein [Caulobacteraceae bacterium]|nr:AtpZ/AtpI family protein [Caulobacteraceae bacterium]
MTVPDPQDGKAIDRLGDKLKAFEAKRGGGGSAIGDESGIGEGYRLLGSLLGGVLGGVGFGWLFDKFAHTAPWGMIGGLLIGTVAAIVSVVRTAGRMSDKAAAASGPARPAPEDDEDD